MKKFLGYILSPIAISAFFVLLCIFHPIQWMCYNWLGYKAHKRAVDILNFFLLHTPYLIFDPVTYNNKYDLPPDRPMIFIANHQSLFDIPPMIYYLRKYHVKFISKVELTRGIPSISYNLKVGGGANIDRTDPRQSITELVKFAGRMKDNNWSAAIFPEGTRSKDGKVKPFQSAGIATILKKCPNALLVPVAIKDTWKMSQYGLYPLSTFTPMSWTILEPLEPNGRPGDELVKEVEDRIRAVIEK